MRPGDKIRLERFADAYMLTGNANEAARAVGVVGKTPKALGDAAGRMKKQAEAMGLFAQRAKVIQGRFEIDVGRLVRKAYAMLEGEIPSRTRTLYAYDKKTGKRRVTALEEFRDPLKAVEVLARMAGALVDRAEMEAGPRLAELLGEVLTQAKELREQDRKAGIIPTAARIVRERAIAALNPAPQPGDYSTTEPPDSLPSSTLPPRTP